MQRYEIERAVRRARLPAPWVAVVLTLCTRIWQPEGIIRGSDQPSLNELAADTGYHRSTVKRSLNGLESAQWVIRVRPSVDDARRLHARTAYALRVPSVYPQARSMVSLELGARSAQAWLTAGQGMAHDEPRARRTVSRFSRSEEEKKPAPGPPPFAALGRDGRIRPEQKGEDF